MAEREQYPGEGMGPLNYIHPMPPGRGIGPRRPMEPMPYGTPAPQPGISEEMEVLARGRHEKAMKEREEEIRQAMFEQLRQRAMQEMKRKGTWLKPGVQEYSPARRRPDGVMEVTDPWMYEQALESQRQIRETRTRPYSGRDPDQQAYSPSAPPGEVQMDPYTPTEVGRGGFHPEGDDPRFEFPPDDIPEWMKDEMRFEFPGDPLAMKGRR